MLLSGDHAAIARWRHASSVVRTKRWRPDLIEAAGITEDEVREAIAQIGDEDVAV